MRYPPPDLLARIESASVDPGSIALWHTGGAGYVLRTLRATIYLDPFTGASPDPVWVRDLAPPFDAAAIARCDLLLSTHEHFDHCDPDALEKLLRVSTTTFAGPASSIEVARGLGWPESRLRVLAWGDTIAVNGVQITAVKSVDPMAKGCNGYVFAAEGLTYVNMGDSLWYDDIGKELSRWTIDAIGVSVAQNPRGGTYYMSEIDAVRIARDVKAKVLVPHHWDLWHWVLLDPRRIQAVAPWYAPETRVVPARYAERLTLVRAGNGVAVV